jgi:flagellar hook-length control protein FliK
MPLALEVVDESADATTSNAPEASVGSHFEAGDAAAEVAPQPRVETSQSSSAAHARHAQAETKSAELVERVASALRQSHESGRQLRVRLSPPELGTLQIEVSARNGVLSVRLDVQTATAHQVILENLPLLHDALAQHGTTVERIDVQIVRNSSDAPFAQFGGDGRQQGEQPSDQRHQPRQQPEIEPEDETGRRSIAPQHIQLEQLDVQI